MLSVKTDDLNDFNMWLLQPTLYKVLIISLLDETFQ